MEIYSKQKAVEWLESREFRAENYAHARSYRIPADSGRKSALARLLVRELMDGSGGESLFWIDEYGIWPSSEMPSIFQGYRASLGERRPLSESECHLFDEHDSEKIECLVALVLYFAWGALLVNAFADAAVRISHDEVFTLYAKTQERLAPFEQAIREFDLSPL